LVLASLVLANLVLANLVLALGDRALLAAVMTLE
jgi:hypothetical protein